MFAVFIPWCKHFCSYNKI